MSTIQIGSRRAKRARASAVAARVPVRRDHGGGGIASTALDLAVRATVRPLISAWTLAPGAPWPYALVDNLGRLLPPVRGASYERIRLPHCPATVVTNSSPHPDAATGRTIIYLHGGAFLVGGNHLHRHLLGRISARTGATIIAPQYRKLPTHTVTDAGEDALDAYRYALAHGADPATTMFMGDSAGGFLAVMLAVAAQRAGLPQPAGVVAMSPLVDFVANDTPDRGCTMFPASAIGRFQQLAAKVNRRKGLEDGPIDSPCHSPRRGLAPTLVQVSSSESLYTEGVRLAEHLASAGVPVELDVWDNQMHVFQAAAGLLREGAEALENLAEFTDRATASATGTSAARRAGIA